MLPALSQCASSQCPQSSQHTFRTEKSSRRDSLVWKPFPPPYVGVGGFFIRGWKSFPPPPGGWYLPRVRVKSNPLSSIHWLCEGVLVCNHPSPKPLRIHLHQRNAILGHGHVELCDLVRISYLWKPRLLHVVLFEPNYTPTSRRDRKPCEPKKSSGLTGHTLAVLQFSTVPSHKSFATTGYPIVLRFFHFQPMMAMASPFLIQVNSHSMPS